MSDIDVNAIADTLNSKVQLPDGVGQDAVDFVVDSQLPTAENNYTWYRLYRSGWVEQGGEGNSAGTTTATVTFLKPFLDTNYTLTLGTNYSRDTGHYLPGFDNKTTTGFTFSGASSSTTISFNKCQYIACGMSAQGGI